MKTEIYRRPMTVTLATARRELQSHLNKTGVKAQRIAMDVDPKTNEIVATVKLAELPMGGPADAGPPPPPMGGGDLGPDGPGEPGLGEPPHGHPSKEDEILDLLHSIADKVGVHDDPDGLGPDGGEGGDLDLGDGGGEDLPAPVEEPKKDAMFSSLNKTVKGRRAWAVERHAAHEVTDEQLIAEVTAGFPGAKVARIVRNADNTLARIALTR